MRIIEKKREIVWIQIFYFYIVPILLLYFNLVSEKWRVVMLLLVALLLFGTAMRARWTWKDLGFKHDFLKDTIPYALFTVAGVLFLLWLSKIVPHEPLLPEWWRNTKFLLLFIPISVLQEIIFRGVLMNFLDKAFSKPIFVILLNSAIFAFMHVIYLNSIFVLPMTFIAGVGFAWMYYEYKNLVLVSISHTILNFVAVALGFFVVR